MTVSIDSVPGRVPGYTLSEQKANAGKNDPEIPFKYECVEMSPCDDPQ